MVIIQEAKIHQTRTASNLSDHIKTKEFSFNRKMMEVCSFNLPPFYNIIKRRFIYYLEMCLLVNASPLRILSTDTNLDCCNVLTGTALDSILTYYVLVWMLKRIEVTFI